MDTDALAPPRSRILPPPPPPSSRSRVESCLDLDLDIVEEIPPTPPPRRSSTPPPLPASRKASATATLKLPPPAGLPHLEDPVAVALVAEALRIAPSLAGLLVLRDREDGGFVVADGHGPGVSGIVRARSAAGDALIASAVAALRPLVVEFGPQAPMAARHAFFGRPRRAIIVPLVAVLGGTRCLGSIELVEPAATLSLDASAALRRVAQRCVQHMTSRSAVMRHQPSTPAE